MRKRDIAKCIAHFPEIWYAKYYDYKAVKKGNHYEIYRRTFENKPWVYQGRAVIVDNLVFSDWSDVIDTRKEGHCYARS